MNKQEVDELSKLVQDTKTPADATQRVPVSGTDGKPATPAGRTPRPSRPAPSRKAARKRRANRVLIITLCVIVLLLILAAVLIHNFTKKPVEDDGRIHNNVYAAGVNLSGMTPEDAKMALQAATDYTYTQLDMTITVLDQEIRLSPSKTGAHLDVDAVVQAAYDYGRTSGSSASNYISILPYLNLNTAYISSVVDKLGETYSSIRTEPTYRLEGDRPNMNVGIHNVDTTYVHQTLIITMGTPEYGLNTEKLYNQIMDAYESNIFSVQAECSVDTPGTLNIDDIYADCNCIEPVDAILNDETFEVTSEIYGYGFDIDAARAKLENAGYGEVIEIGLTFIEPNITTELLAGDLFKDVLAEYVVGYDKDSDVLTNLKLVCAAIDGKLIKSGEKFSFNTIVGQTSKLKGYTIADSGAYALNDGTYGGGVSLISSAIYYCAVYADMEITERAGHIYVSDYIIPGLDADVSYGVQDLIFTNTSTRPIRINAKVSSKGVVTISFEGTLSEEYTVKVTARKTKTLNPTTLIQQMMAGNAAGYENGTVLIAPITGYEYSVYRTYRNNTTQKSEEKLVANTTYQKRNAVVVNLVEPEPTIPPTETTIPPSETTVPPSETTTPPSETTVPPSETTTPPSETTTPPAETTAPPQQ